MLKKSFVIQNKTGLQLWPAVTLISAIDAFDSRVMMVYGGNEYNAKSILGLMSAMVKCGETVEFVLDGTDEYEALGVVQRLFDDGEM